jgi:hypothetical protein
MDQARINAHLEQVEALQGSNFSEIVFAHVAVSNYVKCETRIGIECSLYSAEKRKSTR